MSRDKNNRPTPQQIKALLEYDEQTGIFVWKYRPELEGTKAAGWNRRYVGKQAGYVYEDGYIGISIRKVRFPAHVLAWVIVKGDWPERQIDHINTKRDDNRLENLRLASAAQNAWNVPLAKKNKSGVKHVSWHRGAQKWQVKVRANSKDYYYGVHDDFELACVIAAEAAAKHHGEFARLS